MYTTWNITEMTAQQLMYEVRELKEDNFLGSITLDEINSVKRVEGFEWQEKIKVTTKACSKIINFPLDTGTDVTVIPDRNYEMTGDLYFMSPDPFMNGKLRTLIPTVSAKYTFCQYNAEKYKSIDAKIKERQKMNFDTRHWGKELSSFVEELQVPVNAPKTTQAKGAKSLSPKVSSSENWFGTTSTK